MAAVAVEVDAAPSTTHRWLIDAGAAMRRSGTGRTPMPLDADELRRRVAAGAPVTVVAEELGVSAATIRRRLERQLGRRAPWLMVLPAGPSLPLAEMVPLGWRNPPARTAARDVAGEVPPNLARVGLRMVLVEAGT